jgi:hypothetical protein
MAAANGAVYKVKSGDSLWKIARHHYGHGQVWPSIFAFNQLDSVKPHVRPRLLHPDKLTVGQTIYLPRRLYVQRMKRAPGQHYVPGRIGQTRPARALGATGQAMPGQNSGAPPAPPHGDPIASSPAPGHNQDNGQTLVNKYGVKIDTSQHRTKFKSVIIIGSFEIETEFKGTMILRHDATVPVATFSKDNFEYTYKNEMLNAAGALTAVTKLGVDWQKKTGTAELMFTSNLIAGKQTPISLGLYLDERGPALRGKAEFKGVHGVVHRVLYFVQDDETLTIQVTVRWLGPTEPPPGVHVLIPVGVPITAPIAVPGPSPVPTPAPHPPIPGLNPAPQPAPAPPFPPIITSSPAPTQQESDNILMHAGKWAQSHPVAAVAVGVAVVGLVIVALPEEAVAAGIGGAVKAGQWLLLGGGAAAVTASAR